MSLLLIKYLQLFLVAAILILFLAKLLTVANYQQRTGDYFTNKILFRYYRTDFSNNCGIRRRKAMARANAFDTAFWVCVTVLVALVITETQSL